MFTDMVESLVTWERSTNVTQLVSMTRRVLLSTGSQATPPATPAGFSVRPPSDRPRKRELSLTTN